MARKSKTRNFMVLVLLVFACFGGYTLWNSYGEPAYDVVKDKVSKVHKVLEK